MGFKLRRHSRNPILTADPNVEWEAGAVFNPGASTLPDGTVVLLYRAIHKGYRRAPSGAGYIDYISSIGIAKSKNGIDFVKEPQPALKPDQPYDRWGCEDPRVTKFRDNGEETYIVTYTALSAPAFSGRGNRVGIAISKDLKTFEKFGPITPEKVQDKDAVVFPRKVSGKVALLHRIEPNIQIMFYSDLDELLHFSEEKWRGYLRELDRYTIMRPKYSWEELKIGAGAPPIETDEGWLLIYHGVDRKRVYRAGVALLDLEDPTRVIARSPYPILEPEEEYELIGDVNNVVFPEGAVVLGDDLFVYYGAADKRVCLATAKLSDLLSYLREFKV